MTSREIITDIPKELRQMLGEGEEVLYKGKPKDMRPEENLFILPKFLSQTRE